MREACSGKLFTGGKLIEHVTDGCITNPNSLFVHSYINTGVAARNTRTEKLDRTRNSKIFD